MKGEKITSLDELIEAIIAEKTIVDKDGDAWRLIDNSVRELQAMLDDGLYIKQEPEVPKCPYCQVKMELDTSEETSFYSCGNLKCPVIIRGPDKGTPKQAAEALLLPKPKRLTDEEIEEEAEEAVREFKDKEATIAIIYRRGMKRARDIMEGRG